MSSFYLLIIYYEIFKPAIILVDEMGRPTIQINQKGHDFITQDIFHLN